MKLLSRKPINSRSKFTRLEFDERSKDLADLLSAINDSATAISVLYITFLLFLIYAGLVIASTTDDMLLKNTDVRLPLLNTDVPIIGFYVATPWLLTIFHIDLLLHFVILGRKIERLLALLGKKLSTHLNQQILGLFGPFHYLHLFAESSRSLIAIILRGILCGILVALPLVVLLWAQGRFLPYHELTVTRAQQVAITIDVLALLSFWPLISHPVVRNSRSSAKTRWWALYPFLFSVLGASWFLFTVPIIDPLEVRWLSKCGSDQGILDETCRWGFSKRNLDLRDRILVVNNLTPEQLNALKSEAAPERQRIIDSIIIGLDLRGRDLRHANFSNSVLPKADFRPNPDGVITNLEQTSFSGADLGNALVENANLQDSNLENSKLSHAKFAFSDMQNCKMQSADLSYADLHWANLTKSKMTGASLFETNLTGANLNSAVLDATKGENVRLDKAILSNAVLRNAIFTAASLSGAKLDGAELDGAEFVLADFSLATLKGATLKRVLITGSDFKGAHMQGVDLSYSTLDATSMSGVLLAGANLRHAHIHNVEWNGAQFDTTDLREIEFEDSKVISYYSQILERLGPQLVKNTRINSLLIATRSRLRLSQKQLLTGAIVLGSIQCDKNKLSRHCVQKMTSNDFTIKRARKLASLACSDVSIAAGIVRQFLATEGFRYEELPIMSKEFIAGNIPGCYGILELDTGLKKSLENMAKLSSSVSLKRIP